MHAPNASKNNAHKRSGACNSRSNLPQFIIFYMCSSVEQIGDFCNPNPVQNFRLEIRSDPNPLDLSKYLIQSGL